MVVVFGDLIADLSIRIPEFPVRAQDLKPITYLEIGPGGATNIAIMAARFGLAVSCMGEVGRDSFGEVVMQGLKREGIETADIVSTPESKTPVAGVVVDEAREPAYLGYKGQLTVKELTPEWQARIQDAQALFADGWIEIPEMAQMIVAAFQLARRAGVKTFFDPGPGNPALDLGWHKDAAALADVLLVNEEEAGRLTDSEDADAAAQALVRNGSEMVVLKRGARGMTLVTAAGQTTVSGFKVHAVDLTGAGDSVTGSILYGYLNGLPLDALGTLANATGAAKVQKLGTGHNMPTPKEIHATLKQFAPQFAPLVEKLNRDKSY